MSRAFNRRLWNAETKEDRRFLVGLFATALLIGVTIAQSVT